MERLFHNNFVLSILVCAIGSLTASYLHLYLFIAYCTVGEIRLGHLAGAVLTAVIAFHSFRYLRRIDKLYDGRKDKRV